MKVRLTYLAAFLFSILSLASAGEAAGSIVSKTDARYGVPTAYSGACFTAAVGSKGSGQSGRQGSGRGETGTQIRQAPDVVVQGSIVPACDVVLSLIAVLHLQRTEGVPQLVDPPNRQTLFKALFRVIISPNAP